MASVCLEKIEDLIAFIDGNLYPSKDAGAEMIHGTIDEEDWIDPGDITDFKKLNHNLFLSIGNESAKIFKIQVTPPYIAVKHEVFDLYTQKDKLLWSEQFNLGFDDNKSQYQFIPTSLSVNKSGNEFALDLYIVGNNQNQKYLVLFSNLSENELPKLSDHRKQRVYPMGFAKICYFGDTLMAVDDDFMVDKFRQGFKLKNFHTNSGEWVDCFRGNEWIDIDKVFVIRLPHDSVWSKYAIHCQFEFDTSCLYRFNFKLNKFVNIKVFATAGNYAGNRINITRDGETSIKYVTFEERMFYISAGNLYELTWHPTAKKMINRCQHLDWMTSTKFDGISRCGEYGMALLINDWNNCNLVFYNPNTKIIRTVQNKIMCYRNMWFEHGIWFDEVKKFMLMSFSQCDVFILTQTFLRKSKCFHIRDEQDVKYQLWESSCVSNMMSTAYDRYFDHEFDIDRRTYALHCCKYKSKCYQIIAGYNCDDSKYPQLKYLKSKRFKALSSIAELRYYLGGPVWYIIKEQNEHVVSTGTLLDFSDKRGLTKPLSDIVVTIPTKSNIRTGYKLTAAKKYIPPNDIDWIAVIDVRDQQMLDSRDNILPDIVSPYDYLYQEMTGIDTTCASIPSVDVKYDRLYSNEFYITKGRAVCGRYNAGERSQLHTQFGNVQVGKWCWKIKEDNEFKQLLAFHESVKDDKEYMDSWEIDDEIFKHENDSFSFEDMEETEQKCKQIFVALQHNIGWVSDDIIVLISQFCHYVKQLHWVERKVLDDKWYLHNSGGGEGIFDYDHFNDASVVKNPYSFGYDWFSFEEEGVKIVDHLTGRSDIWTLMVAQSFTTQNPCSIQYGCIWHQFMSKDNATLAKIHPKTDTVICIKVVSKIK
eukprot:158188_1